METDASKCAEKASLLQEIDAEDDSTKKVMICAASRSFKSAETRQSTIRRKLVAVVSAVQKFRSFSVGRDFIIRKDHWPLMVLCKKSTLERERRSR